MFEDGNKLKNFTRMSKADFTFVLNGIRDAIQKTDATFRAENFPLKIRKLIPYGHTLTHRLIRTHTHVPALTQYHTHSVTQTEIHFLTHTFTEERARAHARTHAHTHTQT